MPGLIRKQTRARRVLDWQVAREQLARLAANDGTPDLAERERILNERARALARRPDTAASAESAATLEVLLFKLGQENYAIESQFLHQVLLPGDLTRLPGAPAILRGLTNLRGEIMPVFDLREALEAERTAPSEESRWLLLGIAEPELCLWVDAVFELRRIDPTALADAERGGRAIHGFVRGVTRDAHSVLDAGQILASRQLFIGDAPNGGGGAAS